MRFAPRTGIGGIDFPLVECLVTLAIVAEEITKPLRIVHVAVVVITEGDNGGVLVQHPDKDRPVAMPPAIVIDKFFPIWNEQYPPSQPVVPPAWLLETVSGISAVQHSL